MSFTTKLVLGLGVILALIVGQAILSIRNANDVSNASRDLAVTAMKRVEHITHLNASMSQHRGEEVGYILRVGAGSATQTQRQNLDRLWVEVEASLQAYIRAVDDPERLESVEALVLRKDSYAEYRHRVLVLSEQGRQKEADLLFSSAQSQFDEIMNHVHQLRHEEFGEALELAAASQRASNNSWYLLALTIGVVGFAGIGLTWYLWRSLSGGLSNLLEGTRRVSEGDLSLPVPVTSNDEFGEVAISFNTMQEALVLSQEQNRRLTNETLGMREERVSLLQDSLVKVVQAQEDERQRVARELHDQAGQALTMLHLGLSQLEHEDDAGKLRERASLLRSLTQETMEEVRNLAFDLRPAALDELGLVPAMRGYVRELSGRVGIPIHLEQMGLDGRLPAEVEVVLFRAVQEGLTNMVKHSQASNVTVTLEGNSGSVEARVADDGVGFKVSEVLGSEKRRALGLFGMRERVSLLGGTLQIESEPNGGTVLQISVPVNHSENGAEKS
jgi:signal transduction histidine kinase